jgi:hypothetical protein
MGLLRGAVTGEYEIIGDPAYADCVLGMSFGARDGEPSPVNQLLANVSMEYSELPLLLQQEIVDALPDGKVKPVFMIDGQPSTATGSGLDSWSVLLGMREFMDQHNLEQPLLVAQAYHVSRVAAQARRLGMRPIVPRGLPKIFDPESIQSWTRSRALWVPREIVGMGYLAVQGKL